MRTPTCARCGICCPATDANRITLAGAVLCGACYYGAPERQRDGVDRRPAVTEEAN